MSQIYTDFKMQIGRFLSVYRHRLFCLTASMCLFNCNHKRAFNMNFSCDAFFYRRLCWLKLLNFSPMIQKQETTKIQVQCWSNLAIFLDPCMLLSLSSCLPIVSLSNWDVTIRVLISLIQATVSFKLHIFQIILSILFKYEKVIIISC